MNQTDVLEYLKKNGQMTAPEVADALGITYHSAYFKLAQLHRYALVEKIEGHHDTIWRAIR